MTIQQGHFIAGFIVLHLMVELIKLERHSLCHMQNTCTLNEHAAKKIGEMQLSNKTVSRCIKDLSSRIDKNLIDRLELYSEYAL